MSENTVSSNLQVDSPNAMILAQSVHHDSQAQWGIMPNNLQYSDVQYYTFMNLFDLQDLISPSSEEETAQNIWNPHGCVDMEKDRIKNVQYSTSTPWFVDDYTASRINSNCEANIKWPWPENNTAAQVQAKTWESNPGKRALVPISARVQDNKNGESKRVRISSKDFELPQGWITWKQERLNGRSAGNKDAHYMELSTKKRFRSRVEVERYLQNKEQMVVLNEVDDRCSQSLVAIEESCGLQGTTMSISTDHVHRKKTLTREKLQSRRPKKSAATMRNGI